MSKIKFTVKAQSIELVMDIFRHNLVGGRVLTMRISRGIAHFVCQVENAEMFRLAVTDFCLTIEETK